MAGAQGKTADLQVSLLSSPEPGAVAMLQLSCSSPAVLSAVLAEFTGRPVGSPQRLLWRPLAGVDDGLVMWEPGYALIMPHGGPRVVQRLLERLVALGAQVQPHPPAETVYPEAATPLEAAMLAAMAMAASPAALDLLAAQPARWQAWWRGERSLAAVIREPLDALLVPPTVVVAGQPNVGKSTLTNHLLGRSAALVADLPGTTRDWVAGRVELPLPWSGSDAFLAVRWLDTPGLRSSDDAIEQRAIDLARGVMASARVLIAMRSPELDWPETGALPREPDLWVENKVDLSAGSPALPEDGDHPARPLRIGAREGLGIAALQRAIVQRLGLDREPGTGPWAFCETLRRLGRGEVSGTDWFEGAWSQDRAD